MPDGLPSPYMASRLIQDMAAAHGLTISIVMQWDGAIWISHRYDLPFTDFALDLYNQGIFVHAVSDHYYAGTWRVKGKKIKLPRVIQLQQGWTLVNIPTTISTNTAIETLEQIKAQGTPAEVMMWWDGAIWISTYSGLTFTDQNLVKGRGYFIRCKDRGPWRIE
jgi:hypothetical protein